VNPHDLALALVDGALAALDAERAVINDLNVYPVPDGDTGTNLFLTVRAIREELEKSPSDTMERVAASVTRGSLMGARGNSGVILSQIIRGACSVCAEDGALDTRTLKKGFEQASAAAYRAVKKPVEGTMLTVVREMAAAAGRLPDQTPLPNTIDTVLAAGKLAVDRTMHQLAALRQAGVVDAGGYGLLVICRGLAVALATPGEAAARPVALAATLPAAAPVASGYEAGISEEATELSEYRYCTSFLLSGERLSTEELESFLAPIGDSALVVGDERALKVHVHTDDPGSILSWAVQRGAITEVEINDMHAQTRERDERLRAARKTTGTAVIAVAAGAGNHGLFRELGCTGIVDGGQSMNPSAAQLLDLIEEIGSDQVVILPNNRNVILTAEQAAGMSTRTIEVVPSKSMPAGLSCMVAFDPEKDAVTNATAMRRALESAHSAEITVAVRDSLVGDLQVKKDAVIGLVDGTLVAQGTGLQEVLDTVLASLAVFEPEYLTVLTSLNGTTIADEDIAAAVERVVPGAELDIREGGQPLYPILVGAE
jgi:DAK2 domain fusion protein YloV